MFFNLLRKIRNKTKALFAYYLIKFSLLVHWPNLTARVLGFLATQANETGEFTVLCLGRSIFTLDIKALATFGSRIRYLVIHRSYFQIIFTHFLDRCSSSERSRLTEFNYHTENFCAEGREQYYLYLKKMFPKLQSLLGFDAIMSGNIGYLNQQELIKICEEQKLAFIVLHKEGMDVFGGYVNLYKTYRFNVARVLLYNEAMRDTLLNFHLPDITPNKLQVVGIPRFDFYFAEAQNPKALKQITFFSFQPPDRFLAMIEDESKRKQAEGEYEKFHKLVMDFASRHKDFKVVIKTKNAQKYLDYVNRIYKKNFASPLDNLVITNAGEASDLILDSFAVIGFSSTVLIEAVCADKILISPDLEGYVADRSWDFFGDYPGLVNYVRGLEDLENIVLQGSRPQIKIDKKEKFLKKYIYLADGRASARAEEAIIHSIKEQRVY